MGNDDRRGCWRFLGGTTCRHVYGQDGVAAITDDFNILNCSQGSSAVCGGGGGGGHRGSWSQPGAAAFPLQRSRF